MACHLINLLSQILFDHFLRFHARVHETSVVQAFDEGDWELVLLLRDDVLLLVPVGLSTSGDSHQTVLLTNDGEDWVLESIDDGLALVIDGSLFPKQNRAHENGSLHQIWVALGVVLGEDTGQGVGCQVDLISREALLLESLEHALDLVTDFNWVRGVE